jgi:hypothetical protein
VIGLRKSSLPALLVMAVALVLLAAPAQARKPDLSIVDNVELKNPVYGFKEEPSAIKFSDVTKNKRTAGAAGKSHTGLILSRAHVQRQTATRTVPKLAPGASSSGLTSDQFTWGMRPGRYNAKVCADIDQEVIESNEDNNCVPLDQDFYVVKKTWSGSLNGAFPIGGAGTQYAGSARESYSSTDAKFTFDGYLGEGQFSYGFSGHVTWKEQGTDLIGCSYSGGATKSLSALTTGPGLLLDYDTEHYLGGAGGNGGGFMFSMACPGLGTSSVPGPFSADFLQVNPVGTTGLPLPFGTIELEGSSSAPFTDQAWHWDFT